jgi:hypothetical protein
MRRSNEVVELDLKEESHELLNYIGFDATLFLQAKRSISATETRGGSQEGRAPPPSGEPFLEAFFTTIVANG